MKYPNEPEMAVGIILVGIVLFLLLLGVCIIRAVYGV